MKTQRIAPADRSSQLRYYHQNRDDLLFKRALARGLGADPYDPERDRRRYERERLQRLMYGQLQYLLRTDMEKT